MLFSVLIAHYNNARFLREAINSILNQSYDNWEIIIVDDASVDDFENVVSEYKNDSRIRIFRNEKNMGCGYTKRKCAEKASGSVLAFLDPDDTIHPDALVIMEEAHRKRQDCSIIHSTFYICDDAMNKLRIAEYPKPLPENTPYLLVGDGSIHHFATFKKSSYDETVGISPLIKKAVDQDLYYKLEEEGNVFFINEPLYNYRIHEGSISNMGNEGAAKNAHYTIIEKACLRRIRKLKKSNLEDARYWIKKYRTRYYKIRVLNSFRRKQWPRFASSLLIFPFVGGWENMISYFKKLPDQGFSLFRKSFIRDYKILE